ncbi:MAG: hypothetical protein ABFD94_15865 [Armatimonadia bacterium]
MPTSTSQAIVDYLKRAQDFTPGQYYGSLWSEKAYHGPLLDWHGGGAHHYRGAGSAALGLWLVGQERGDDDLLRRAEFAFDWVVTGQRPSGGYLEIQNNEKPSDWEFTGLEECSTIETSFVVHGLAGALLRGLPPKKSYLDCLQRAGHWYLGLEWPAGSGIFPHHERSPYDTLNANLHTGESLAAIFTALREVYGRTLNIFYQGARRTINHTLAEQWPSGCFPYRANNGITINYTSLVVWCLLNTLDTLPEYYRNDVAPADAVQNALDNAAGFLRTCVGPDGSLLWEENETSTAKHNVWTYALTANVLRRIPGEANAEAASRLLNYTLSLRTASGLLPMRDVGEEITECAYMQADMLLFLLGQPNQ